MCPQRWLILGLLLLTGCAAPSAPAAAVPAPTDPPRVPTALPPTPTTARPTVPLPTAAKSPVTAPSPAAAAASDVKADLRFDGARAYQHALDQCAIGPRPPGTPALQKTRDYITKVVTDNGWTVEKQSFTYRGVPVENIIAKKGDGPVTIIGAHFDTRPIAEKDPDPARRQTPIIGGNDGASGVALLLELSRVWAKTPPPGQTWLAFFDAEDAGSEGLPGWPWSVGASHMADTLTVTPKQVIVVDMIGDNDQQIYLETTSNQPLLNRIFDAADALGYQRWIIRQPRWAITDDHTPFLQRGIPAVDLIDFDYPYHHTVADDCTKIGPDSLERVGRTLELFMKRGG